MKVHQIREKEGKKLNITRENRAPNMHIENTKHSFYLPVVDDWNFFFAFLNTLVFPN